MPTMGKQLVANIMAGNVAQWSKVKVTPVATGVTTDPLNMKRVRAEIDSLNRKSPYLSIVPIIRPGRKSGTMEMEIKVSDRLPVWSHVEINNRYTSLTTETRASMSAGYDNLWQKHHALSLPYMISPENTDEVSTWSMTYSLPTGRSSKLSVFAMDSDSRVGFASGSDNILVQGFGQTLGVRSVHFLQAAPAEPLN